MKIAIHQANFIPNYPFFYKMAMADKFVILGEVQFEKNNFQNRYLLNDKDVWVTKPVRNGLDKISEKEYCDGQSLMQLNIEWIEVIKNTLNINTEIVYDYCTHRKGTLRLIDLIHFYQGDTYITNPDAKNKYLDEELMTMSGIKIEYCDVPKHLRLHTFEVFEKFGIDGAIKQLPRKNNAELTTTI